MRSTRTTAPTAIAAITVCGALALGTAGPALAAAPPPPSAAGRAGPAPAANTDEVIANLADTLALATRFTREARAKAPNVAALRDLQQRVRHSSDRLLSAVWARGVNDARARDDVSGVQKQLDKLNQDLPALLKAVQDKDTSKVTSLVPQVLADLQALLTSVPGLLGDDGGAGLPTLPSLPIPLPAG
ncbi:hypothetical protein [Streptomyces sp. UNOC14_S4]|uniref:hypothetical protein n=1 Tax=Streptomyces sp. UNOC14_S4 TaxID=2872340 RepID=UPI001E28E143|nr:hypothetical protein [Streptomyces sp. UNOC14_S4]MCC3766666.1 hypothetical protein [Streptomyces sp. UNOC14_S4]